MDKKQDPAKKALRQAKLGAIILVIAAVAGVLLAFPPFRSSQAEKEAVQESPKVTYIPARPSTAPTPTPTVTSLKVSTFGSEVTSDGFTTFVGDKAIVLTAAVEPSMKRPPIFWSVSDTEAVSLGISDDRLTCEFKALKPVGKVELTVRCYGAEQVFPIFLWER